MHIQNFVACFYFNLFRFQHSAPRNDPHLNQVSSLMDALKRSDFQTSLQDTSYQQNCYSQLLASLCAQPPPVCGLPTQSRTRAHTDSTHFTHGLHESTVEQTNANELPSTTSQYSLQTQHAQLQQDVTSQVAELIRRRVEAEEVNEYEGQ